MENSITWLLIADASKARIFSLHKARLFANPKSSDNFILIGEYTHDKSRLKKHELVTDRMGEFGSGTFVEATSPKIFEAEQFALELLSHLEINRHHYRDLIFVAPPTFMGLLCKHIPRELQKLITQQIEKDYTQQNKNDLLASLLTHF